MDHAFKYDLFCPFYILVSFQDGFIGFGGNIIREKVKQNAPWFVTDMQELINEIKH